jgi:hypothetical protein
MVSIHFLLREKEEYSNGHDSLTRKDVSIHFLLREKEEYCLQSVEFV